MTDAPSSPGRGLPVYQPATAVVAGTWSVPDRVRPSLIRRVWTPVAGMIRSTGGAVTSGLVSVGSFTARPTGIARNGVLPSGVAVRPPRLAATNPAAAMTHA